MLLPGTHGAWRAAGRAATLPRTRARAASGSRRTVLNILGAGPAVQVPDIHGGHGEIPSSEPHQLYSTLSGRRFVDLCATHVFNSRRFTAVKGVVQRSESEDTTEAASDGAWIIIAGQARAIVLVELLLGRRSQ